MTRQRRIELNHLEGRRVNLSLIDGSRIDDCQLVLAGRFKLWVFVNGRDAFLSLNRVTDVWEAASTNVAARGVHRAGIHSTSLQLQALRNTATAPLTPD